MRRGFTLVELIVVLVILGLLSGLGVLAFATLRTPRATERLRALERARATAIRLGVAVTVSDSGAPIRFLPDGRAEGRGVDPLTGRVTDGR